MHFKNLYMKSYMISANIPPVIDVNVSVWNTPVNTRGVEIIHDGK